LPSLYPAAQWMAQENKIHTVAEKDIVPVCVQMVCAISDKNLLRSNNYTFQ
jgi:hypothetical protein